MKILLLVFAFILINSAKSQTLSFDKPNTTVEVDTIAKNCNVSFNFSGGLVGPMSQSYFISDIETGSAKKGIDYTPIQTQYYTFTEHSTNIGVVKVQINPKAKTFEPGFINLVITEDDFSGKKRIVSSHIIYLINKKPEVDNFAYTRFNIGASIDYLNKNLSISGLHLEISESSPELIGKFGLEGKIYYTNEFSDSGKMTRSGFRSIPLYGSVSRDTFIYAYEQQKAFGKTSTTNIGFSLSLTYNLLKRKNLSINFLYNSELIIKNFFTQIDSIQSNGLDTVVIVRPGAYFPPHSGLNVGTYREPTAYDFNNAVGVGLVLLKNSFEIGLKQTIGFSNYYNSNYFNTSFYLLHTDIGLRLATDIKYYLPHTTEGNINYSYAPSVRLNLSQTFDLEKIKSKLLGIF